MPPDDGDAEGDALPVALGVEVDVPFARAHTPSDPFTQPGNSIGGEISLTKVEPEQSVLPVQLVMFITLEDESHETLPMTQTNRRQKMLEGSLVVQ